MEPPQEGDKAPPFKAADETGRTWSLADLAGSYAVLFFYPEDDTPGCTTEACGFRDHLGALQEAGAVVLGVSRDETASHRAFKEKYGLPFPLLVDTGELSDAYGTWGEKTLFGHKFEGMRRQTFLIGPDGRIVKVWRRVIPERHAEQVLEALRRAQA